ncbi:hypothetical protein CC2G_000056 [Coprinopsis cinerea AmutBmut pab1-1]|nr:hypothetical protein CC2G_000056 [Coprinopsis cinerea AmutBmut pab1-1]
MSDRPQTSWGPATQSREKRADDVEFALEVGSGLLQEVKRLQTLLVKRDQEMLDMKEEIERLRRSRSGRVQVQSETVHLESVHATRTEEDPASVEDVPLCLVPEELVRSSTSDCPIEGYIIFDCPPPPSHDRVPPVETVNHGLSDEEKHFCEFFGVKPEQATINIVNSGNTTTTTIQGSFNDHSYNVTTTITSELSTELEDTLLTSLPGHYPDAVFQAGRGDRGPEVVIWLLLLLFACFLLTI